jgi:uncharacterized RDD family membrane protein YckC
LSTPPAPGWLRIASGDGVALDLPLAGAANRLGAFLLDSLLLGLAVGAFVIAGALLGLGVGANPMPILLIGTFVLRHGYFVFFEHLWQGATPGKRAAQIRVVSRDGGPLSFGAIVARNVLRDLEIFLPLVAIVAPEEIVGDAPWWLWIPGVSWIAIWALMPLLSREGTRIGDLVAGTIVLRLPPMVRLADEAARGAGGPTFTREQLAIYGEHELETLATVLRDSHQLGLAELGVVARTIAQKIGWTGPEPQQDPERFLRAFYAAQRSALERRLLFGRRKASKHDR